MKKIQITLLSTILVLNGIKAQNGEVAVNVKVKISEFGISNTEKRVDPVFKFYLGSENGLLLNKNATCYKFFSKEPDNSFILPDPKYPTYDKELESFSIPILSRSSFTLVMECYINNRGEVCSFDKKDGFHSITTKIIDLNNYPPGDLSDTIRMVDNQNHFYSIIQFTYTLSRPSTLKTSVPLEKINPSNKPIELSSSFPLSNREKLSFIWEYSIDNGNYWNRLTNANKNDLTIKLDPLNNLFGGKLTSTEKTMFRLRVNSRDTFAISDTLQTYFTAPAPSVSVENKKVSNTCTGYSDGIFKITDIQSISNKILYVVKKAGKNLCDLQNPTESGCPGFVKAGEILNGTIELKNLPVGEYSLLLYNPDLQIGNVSTIIPFTINSFSPLKIQNAVVKNPTCVNSTAGEINVNVEGGSYREMWQIALTPSHGVLDARENRISFKNLDEGDYTLEITDGCGDHLSQIFPLKKPQKLIIDNVKIQATPELALIFDIKNGSGVYRIIASDAKQYTKTIDSFTNMILQLNGPGIWHVQIFDKSDPECLTADTTIPVGGTPKTVPSKKGKASALSVPVNGDNTTDTSPLFIAGTRKRAVLTKKRYLIV